MSLENKKSNSTPPDLKKVVQKAMDDIREARAKADATPKLEPTVTCSNCGMIQTAEAIFCGSCGVPIKPLEKNSAQEVSPDDMGFRELDNTEQWRKRMEAKKQEDSKLSDEERKRYDAQIKKIEDRNKKETSEKTAKEIINETPRLTEEEFNQIHNEDAEKWNPNIKTFKLDLEALLPPAFNTLTKEQKKKVLQDSKRRIVDIVKSDAQTQYSEDLKERMQENVGGKWKHQGRLMTGIRNIKTSIKSSFTKERDLKNTESDIYLKLINSEEGKNLIAKDLELIVDNVSRQSVYEGRGKGFLGKQENLKVSYALDRQKYTEDKWREVGKFNLSAGEFAQMPYEWGQEKRKKYWGNRKKYDDAKAKYEEERAKFLELEKSIDGAEKALATVMEIDNRVRMEQLLNTHPQFEQALNDFARQAGMWEKIKTGLSVSNVATGKDAINRAIIASGALIRTGAKVLPWLAGAGATVTTASTLGAAVGVGGFIGYKRGKLKAEETLDERQKLARYGKKDESAERALTTDATRLTSRLQDLVNEVELSLGDNQGKKLANLVARIEHTIGKIEKGKVNFGDSKTSLVNQFNLVNTLNDAIALREIYSKEVNVEVKNRIDSMLKTIGESVAQKTNTAQTKFITKQAWRGAFLGTGLAGIGYGARWFVENIGWSGGDNSTKTIGNSNANKNVTNSNTANRVSNSNTNTGRDPFLKPNNTNRDPFVKPKSTETPASKATPTPKYSPTPTPQYTPDNTSPTNPNVPNTQADNVPDASTIEKPIEASIVGKGEGVEHAFIKQIEGNPKLAEELGFKGDVNDTKALHKFAQTEAHKIAIKTGYVDNAGNEVRVLKGNEVAYELKMQDGKISVNEKALDGRLIQTRNERDKLGEGINDYEYKESYTKKTTDRPRIIEQKTTKKTIRVPQNIDEIKVKKSDALVVDTGETKVSDKISLRPEDKSIDTQKDIDAEKIAKEQATMTAMDAPATNKKVEPKVSSTPEKIKEEIETQIDLGEKHPELKGTTFVKNTLKLPEEKLVETYRVHEENIRHIFKGATVKDFNAKVGGSPASSYIYAEAVEGDLVTPYLNKVAKLANLEPDYNVATGDENVHNFLERCILKLSKEGKLDEVKNLKLK